MSKLFSAPKTPKIETPPPEDAQKVQDELTVKRDEARKFAAAQQKGLGPAQLTAGYGVRF